MGAVPGGARHAVEYARSVVAAPLDWLRQPCVMGILNVTPDSFSDGGRHLDGAAAIARAEAIAGEGAAIIDAGAESTRPGAEPVPADVQLSRLAPLFAAAREGAIPCPLSIDTTSARVAAAGLDAGAVLVNDVSAGRDDPDLLPVVAEHAAAVCLLHMRGRPGDMQDDPRYADVVGEVADFLAERIDAARAAGIADDAILIDPGIGFGKTLEHNLSLLRAVDRLAELGPPVVIGVSRKGMFGSLLGRPVDERLAGSLGAALAALAGGAAIIRAHDVRETVDAVTAWCAVRSA
jgi:dihydropteroate synthase